METATLINGVDVQRLQGTIQAIRENPSIADFKFRASNRWINGAKNESSIKSFFGAHEEDSSRGVAFTLVADEPDILLGGNEGPNPTETLLHALASCITTTLVYHAAANDWELDGVSSSYEGDLDLHGFLGLKGEAIVGFSAIRIRFNIEGDLSREEKQHLLDIGRKFSPVYSMISKAVPLEVVLA